MNKKLVVKNDFDEIVYCVLVGDKDYEEQLKEVFSISPGQGFTVELRKDVVALRDYFAGEDRATFTILSLEDTELEVQYYWKIIERS